MKIDTWGSWGFWLRIDTQISEIEYGGSYIVDKNVKIHLIGIKIITRGPSKSLIVNIYFKCFNPKWRIQCGGPKCKNLLDGGKNYNPGVSEVADYKSLLEISKSNVAD